MIKKLHIPAGRCVAGVLTGAWVYLRYRQGLRAASERVAKDG